MDNKLSVRALAKSAIARTFIMFLLLFCFNSNVYGANLTPYNEMSEEIARDILDWCSENTTNQTVIDWYKNYDALNFAQYFNTRVQTFKNNLNIDLQYLDQFILYFDGGRLYFFVSNNTLSNTLPYTTFYTKESYDNTRLIRGSYLRLTIQGTAIYDSESSDGYVTNYPYSNNVTFNSDYTVIDAPALAGMTPISTIEGNIYPDMSTKYFFLDNYIYKYESENPVNPSGDTSGDTGGNVDLSGIQNGINNINNNLNNIENKIPTSGDVKEIISGETNKIIDFMSGDANFENKEVSSGDILGAIDYNPPDDPYANFWFELTDILNNAFTGSLREITITGYTGKPYKISIDDINWNPPAVLKTFLTLASTTAVGIALLKWIKIMVDKISSGSIDDVLEANEEGIVNLF